MAVIRENSITFLSHLALAKQRYESLEFSKRKFSSDFNIDELRKRIYNLEELKNSVVCGQEKIGKLNSRISLLKNKFDALTNLLP